MTVSTWRAGATRWAIACGVLLLIWSNSRADIDCAQSPDGCCCSQHIGNIDCSSDNVVDVGDLQQLISFLFVDFTPLPSPEQANLDRDPIGRVDVGDVTALIDHLFMTFTPLPDCPRPFNHPPVTRISLPFSDKTLPYINSLDSTANPAIRIPLSWSGSDRIDHPMYPPPLSFEWRIYGPYDSLTAVTINSSFYKEMFVTNDGQVFRVGIGASFLMCDTVPAAGGMQITCDSIRVDQLSPYTDLGRFVNTLFTEDSGFATNPELNMVAQSSGTGEQPFVLDTSDYAFNLFASTPNDSTTTRTFYFWVRARDAVDSTVVDPAPPARSFKVIDPQFERDVIVLKAYMLWGLNPANNSAAQSYWQQAIASWAPERTFQYYNPDGPSGSVIELERLLRHKIMIIFADDALPGWLQVSSLRSKIELAQEAGVGLWICGRSLDGRNENTAPSLFDLSLTDWKYYFGATGYYFSGWEYWANGLHADPPVRIEDFVGAEAALTGWPSLAVDTLYLHTRYGWVYDWLPEIACPPEVNVTVPDSGAEILFTYQSKYGAGYPYSAYTYTYHGEPVAYRIDRGAFRVVVTNFSPVFMSDSNGHLQTVVDSVLNWLYDPTPAQKSFVQPNSPLLGDGAFQGGEAIVRKRGSR